MLAQFAKSLGAVLGFDDLVTEIGEKTAGNLPNRLLILDHQDFGATRGRRIGLRYAGGNRWGLGRNDGNLARLLSRCQCPRQVHLERRTVSDLAIDLDM